MEKTKILLVDDNEVIRIFFKDVFWLHGLEDKYDLEIADGFESAKKTLQDPQKKPDIVFLDMVMPFNKDGKTITTSEAGLTLLREIKSSPEMKNTKVIIFSGYTDKASMDQAKKNGADMYLAKEDHLPQDLIKVLENLNKGK